MGFRRFPSCRRVRSWPLPLPARRAARPGLCLWAPPWPDGPGHGAGGRRPGWRRTAGRHRVCCRLHDVTLREAERGHHVGQTQRACSLQALGGGGGLSRPARRSAASPDRAARRRWSTWADARALLRAATVISPTMVGHPLDAGDDLVHRVAGLRHQPRAGSTLSTLASISALISLAASALRCGERAHLGRHHREAAALLAGARRLPRPR